MDIILKEATSNVEKEKKSRIFTRDRTSSSNKYKKSPMQKQTTDSDHNRSNIGFGSGVSGENVGSTAEVY